METSPKEVNRPQEHFKPIYFCYLKTADLQAHNHNHHYLQATLQKNKPNVAYNNQTFLTAHAATDNQTRLKSIRFEIHLEKCTAANLGVMMFSMITVRSDERLLLGE